MLFTPMPGDGDVPIHETAKPELEPGEKITISVTPDTAGSTHYVPIIAIERRPGATYTIEVDKTNRYGPDAPAPPTDPNDMAVSFLRALELTRELQITIKDVRETGQARDYETHVMGWEA